MLSAQTSAYLDQVMEAALKAFDVSGWSEDGKAQFLVRRMVPAYETARRMEVELLHE